MIWIIAGTQDGRELAAVMAKETDADIVVTVVSNYGKVLASQAVDDVVVGRLTQQDMEALIADRQITMVIDASHPYAAIVSETARQACRAMRIDYLRYERPEVELPDYDKLYHVKNEAEAAELAGKLGERVYLTTGSKTMAVFAQAPALQDKEVWTRVLPTVEVIQMMQDLGVTPKHTIAMQGPFSYEMNRAMFRDTRADVVVMKNSGLVGGTDTKLAAAMDEGLHIVVIDRPVAKTDGYQVVQSIKEVVEKWRNR